MNQCHFGRFHCHFSFVSCPAACNSRVPVSPAARGCSCLYSVQPVARMATGMLCLTFKRERCMPYFCSSCRLPLAKLKFLGNAGADCSCKKFTDGCPVLLVIFQCDHLRSSSAPFHSPVCVDGRKSSACTKEAALFERLLILHEEFHQTVHKGHMIEEGLRQRVRSVVPGLAPRFRRVLLNRNRRHRRDLGFRSE